MAKLENKTRRDRTNEDKIWQNQTQDRTNETTQVSLGQIRIGKIRLDCAKRE